MFHGEQRESERERDGGRPCMKVDVRQSGVVVYYYSQYQQHRQEVALKDAYGRWILNKSQWKVSITMEPQIYQFKFANETMGLVTRQLKGTLQHYYA